MAITDISQSRNPVCTTKHSSNTLPVQSQTCSHPHPQVRNPSNLDQPPSKGLQLFYGSEEKDITHIKEEAITHTLKYERTEVYKLKTLLKESQKELLRKRHTNPLQSKLRIWTRKTAAFPIGSKGLDTSLMAQSSSAQSFTHAFSKNVSNLTYSTVHVHFLDACG